MKTNREDARHILRLLLRHEAKKQRKVRERLLTTVDGLLVLD